MDSENCLSLELFIKCIEEIAIISDQLIDGWKIPNTKCDDNEKYLTKKFTTCLTNCRTNEQIIVTFEYHVVYNLAYAVPMICFTIWKQDGSLVTMEEYWEFNPTLKDSNMFETLTQLDHPVLCRPFLTLHPCRTQEIMQPFLQNSKNPVISWLSTVAPFVHLTLLEEYFKYC